MNYLIVENNRVINVIVWDGESQYDLPEGQEIFESPEEQVGIGWIRKEDGSFSEPPLIRYAIFRKFGEREVIQCITSTDENFALPIAQQLEYAVARCEDYVDVGWRNVGGSSFIPIEREA